MDEHQLYIWRTLEAIAAAHERTRQEPTEHERLIDAWEQCNREIASCEEYIRNGGTHLETGALLGMVDWRTEKRLIEGEME